MMRLRDLLMGCQVIHTTGNLDQQVVGIAYDSRKTGKDFVFVAIQGLRADGNRFAAQAVANGAAAVISGSPQPT